MPFFDLRIRWAESSDFGPKSDNLGHRILKSDFLHRILQNRTDCVSRPIFFSDRKMKTRSPESDRIINGARTAKLSLKFENVVPEG